MPIKWSILISTVPHRQKLLKRLLDVLLPQLTPDMEVIAYFNRGEKTLGEYRERLTKEAKGEYISCIDDDDLVPEDYVKTIYPLLDGVDYIGFRVKFTKNGIDQLPVIHSLRYQHWLEDESGYYRNISHLNPIKKELALKAGFLHTRENGEDHYWAMKVAPYVKTEHFIDREMYLYIHTENSMFSLGREKLDYSLPLKVTNKQFRYIKESE